MTHVSTSMVFVVAAVAVYAKFGHETAMVAASVALIAGIAYRVIRRRRGDRRRGWRTRRNHGKSLY